MKKIQRHFFLYLRYAWDWVFLFYQIRRYQVKAPPVVFCMANPGSVGGTELQIQIIAEGLKNHFGSALVLLSGKIEAGRSSLFLKRLKALGIPFLSLASLGVIAYDKSAFLKKRTISLLERVIKGSQICHFFNPGSTALVPVVKSIGLAAYYMETGMPTSNGSWQILTTTLKECSYVTSVSQEGLNRLESLYGYKGSSSVIPSMIQQRPYRSRKPVEGVFDIVYFGRMTRGKGIDLLLHSFSQLVQEFPYARLFLIGSGERATLLQDLAQELGVLKQTEFTAWLQDEELFQRLTAADLFCLPSFSEGLPSSILEAMSIGLPILATNVGGIPEIIEHNKSGILIPSLSQSALTQALLALAEKPSLRSAIGEEAFLRWEKMGKKEEILDQLMAAYRNTSC